MRTNGPTLCKSAKAEGPPLPSPWSWAPSPPSLPPLPSWTLAQLRHRFSTLSTYSPLSQFEVEGEESSFTTPFGGVLRSFFAAIYNKNILPVAATSSGIRASAEGSVDALKKQDLEEEVEGRYKGHKASHSRANFQAFGRLIFRFSVSFFTKVISLERKLVRDSSTLFKDRMVPLQQVRRSVLLIAPLQALCVAFCIFAAVYQTSYGCARKVVAGLYLASAVGLGRLLWFAAAGWAQGLVAASILKGLNGPQGDAPRDRVQRRSRYNWWVLWSRVGLLLLLLQIAAAAFLSYAFAEASSERGKSECHQSSDNIEGGYPRPSVQAIAVAVCAVAWAAALAQLLIGSEVLAWRSLYRTKDRAWRAHYREIFDRSIREFLCCMGRPQYWNASEDDDVDAVAALLGDLVAYRAVGASHLEVLAGLALLQADDSNKQRGEGPPPPLDLLKEAAALHPYAVAAYTGWLLDIGRNPLTFPCVWLWRQGVLAPWTRNRRPELEGDNWWRGHAAAFLRYARLEPEVLKKGRVKQMGPSQAVYFVAALRPLCTVVVAVRGTETPEDLLIDGLGRECTLSPSDLAGIFRSDKNSDSHPTSPHFGHAGVIASARELAKQLDNMPEEEEEEEEEEREEREGEEGSSKVKGFISGERGLLSELLGPGGECEGYALRLVGHSLGGAVATLTGFRLARRFPSLHVYGYGTLPCVDSATAKACSNFVTSVVYHDEFASRLSVASIMRLRAKALRAIAADSGSSPILRKITDKFLEVLPAPASGQAQTVAQKSAHAVSVVSQAVAKTVSHVQAAVGINQNGPSQLNKIPSQWSKLGLPDEALTEYTKEDYASLAQYSMAVGGSELREWREPEDQQKEYKQKRRRRLLKHQGKGLGCVLKHLCLCVGRASTNGKSRPRVEGGAIARVKFEIFEGSSSSEEGSEEGEEGEERREGRGGREREGGAVAVGEALGLGRQSVRAGVGEGNAIESEKHGEEGREGSGEGESGPEGEDLRRLCGGTMGEDDWRGGGVEESGGGIGRRHVGVGVGEGEGEGGRPTPADKVTGGMCAGKGGEGDFSGGAVNMPLLREGVEEEGESGRSEGKNQDIERSRLKGQEITRNGSGLSLQEDVEEERDEGDEGGSGPSWERSERAEERESGPLEIVVEEEPISIAKQLEAGGFLLDGRSSRSLNLAGLDSATDGDLENVKFPAEVYVPGQILHLIREDTGAFCDVVGGFCGGLRREGGRGRETRQGHRAVIGSQEMLKEMVVSPTMFLDHLPWRCSHALNDVLSDLQREGEHRLDVG